MVDVTLVADMVVFYHWARKVDKEWERKAINHLFSMQLDDGGWNLAPGGAPEVNVTVKAYLALKLAGICPTDPRMLKARSVARSLGGPPRLNTFSKLYLALVGLYPWKFLPTIPCEVILLGKWFHVNFWDMSNWSRAMLVPLAIINHYKPTRDVHVTLDELYPHGVNRRELKLQKDPETFTWRNFFLGVDKVNKFAELFVAKGLHPFRRRALKMNVDWMIERFEGSDGLGAIFPGMLYGYIALNSHGYTDDDPVVVETLGQLHKLQRVEKNTVRVEPCFSPVWDTAIATIALKESGLGFEHPALRGAAEWLIKKEIRFRGDWYHKNPADVAPSGWAFEFENKWNPDVDDSAMVLLALRDIETSNLDRRDACFQRGMNWMLTFQCKDGGWAAFDKDCTKGILEKVPFADHNAMLDPECADITARILELLGLEGFSLNHPQVRRALAYLREQQEKDGTWYGRWGVNYIYGTWQVLRGLHALGVDMHQPWLIKSREWFESVQHADGGWGETCDTYDDPACKGCGPSTASQTAWAIMGLCAFGDATSPALKRGIDYLINAQNRDGSWSEDEVTGTGFPKVYYLKYDIYRNTWPLLALATYKQLCQKNETHNRLNQQPTCTARA